MYNEELKDEEIPFLLEHLEAELEDIDGFMNSSYREIRFLGTSPRTIGGNLLDCTLFNLRLCLQYYTRKEEYLRVDYLDRLLRLLRESNGKRIEIDHDLLRDISICEN